MTIDRWFIVCRTLLANRWWTKKKVFSIIACLAFYSIIINIPNIFEVSFCHNYLSFADNCLYFIVAFLIVSTSSLLLLSSNITSLWSWTTRTTSWSTRPLAHPFARWLSPLTHLLAPHCLLLLCTPQHSLVRSLANFAHSLFRREVAIFSMFFTILDYTALLSFVFVVILSTQYRQKVKPCIDVHTLEQKTFTILLAHGSPLGCDKYFIWLYTTIFHSGTAVFHDTLV